MTTTVNAIGSQDPIQVTFGGTGDASFTTFMPICGGTTTTGTLQSISEAGAIAGYVLTYVSNAALPTWQASGSLPMITTNYQILSSGTGTAVWYSNFIDTGSALFNLSIGTSAGNATISGNFNTSVGDKSGTGITSGSQNSAYGYQALTSNTTGARNSAFGYNALTAQTVAVSDNSAFGNAAGAAIISGLSNSVFGSLALNAETSGSNNCAFGNAALKLQIGVSGSSAFGTSAGAAITSGIGNSIFGFQALETESTGNQNCAFGYQALLNQNGVTGSSAFGTTAGSSITSGVQNSMFGYQALNQVATGSRNSAFGYNALNAATLAISDNTAFGNAAGALRAAYTQCTFVGAGADNSSSGLTNTTVVGYNASGTASNQIVIGNGSVTTTFINGINGATVGASTAVLVNASNQLGTAVSSERFKKNIADMGDLSSRILQLQPVNFTFKEDPTNYMQWGLIAEQVAEIMPEIVNYDEEGKPLTVRYHDLPAILLNEMIKMVEANKKLISRIERLEANLGIEN